MAVLLEDDVEEAEEDPTVQELVTVLVGGVSVQSLGTVRNHLLVSAVFAEQFLVSNVRVSVDALGVREFKAVHDHVVVQRSCSC